LIVVYLFVIVIVMSVRKEHPPRGVDEEDFMDFTATTVIIVGKMMIDDQRGSRKYLTSPRKQGPTRTHAQTRQTREGGSCRGSRRSFFQCPHAAAM
jgi:hypothetical protein